MSTPVAIVPKPRKPLIGYRTLAEYALALHRYASNR